MVCLSGCFSDTQKKFKKQIEVKSDTLSIDNTKDTVIIGSKGTTLYLPKDVFTFSDGTSPKGKISIQLKECFSFPEMVRENLTTMTDNQLLETRGMIYVAAFSDNKELQIKNGKSYIIHFPKDTTEKNKIMNLYFGSKDKDENINWNIDTQSILKPTAKINETSWTYSCTWKEEQDYFTFRDDTAMNLHLYFSKTFDNKKLSLGDKLLKKNYLFSFTKTKNGDLIDKKVTEVADEYFSTKPVETPEIDKYVIQFFNSIPALNPNFCKDAPDKTQGSIRIGFNYLPDYRNKEDYNNLFNQKYSVFKNQKIKTMNEAELNYYIFSSSKLGWINCDFFWETKDEKIDYIVKVNPNSKPNIKLIFKQAKSIMAGNLEGDKYIFKNVPIDQEIKIVAVAFNGSKPLLSVSETKTSKQIFDKFQYADFTITDLERQLNNP
ncbi:MAG: hypothetical protein C0459_08680 [Chitinophaga sp.]|nr:hypothetical protein [Chitinophaga sp.]